MRPRRVCRSLPRLRLEPMKYAYAIVEAVVFAAVLLAVFATLIMLGPDQTRRVEIQTCTEDMACWNCDEMGNLICGRP